MHESDSHLHQPLLQLCTDDAHPPDLQELYELQVFVRVFGSGYLRDNGSAREGKVGKCAVNVRVRGKVLLCRCAGKVLLVWELHLGDGVVDRHVAVLTIHVVVAGARIVAHPDTVGRHCLRLLFEHLCH